MRNRILAAFLSLSALAFVGIAGHEAYRGAAYQDSGGVWTLGYGETKGVKPGDKTNPERALIRLHDSVEGYIKALQSPSCLGNIALYQHEFDAFVDLAYNAGAGAVCKSSIPAKLKRGDHAGACKTILSFDKIRIKRKLVSCRDPKNNCRGLIARRQKTYRACIGEAS